MKASLVRGCLLSFQLSSVYCCACNSSTSAPRIGKHYCSLPDNGKVPSLVLTKIAIVRRANISTDSENR